MSNNIEAILIVDGISTAAGYSPIFSAYGIKCIHLFSDHSIKTHFGSSLETQHYTECYTHNGDINETLSLLDKWKISYILHGMDSALQLVDSLISRLNISYANLPALSVARRHKYEMIEAVNKAGLTAPEQYMSNNKESILQWTETHNNFPVIIKPVESAGVKGVFKCSSFNDVERAFDEVMNSSSYYESPNAVVLVQSFSAGREYIIDSVSLRGNHHLTSIWAVNRDKGSSPFLDYMETVDHSHPDFNELRNYAFSALTALGVANGPTHLEVIVTDNGPTIVELNCRLHGSLDLRLTTYACGKNHVQDVICSILSPSWFIHQQKSPPFFSGKAMHVLLRSPESDKRLNANYWNSLKKLPSFVSLKKNINEQSLTSRTIDLKTAVGTLSLFNTDTVQLFEDLEAVRYAEKKGLMYE